MGKFDDILQGNDRVMGGQIATQPPLNANPDQAAEGLSVAKEAGVTPLEAVVNPGFYRDIVRQKRMAEALSSAPKTQHFLGDSANFAVAQDDVEALSFLEGLGNSLISGSANMAASYETMIAAQAQQQHKDKSLSFGEILWDERMPLLDAEGNERGRDWVGPMDLGTAAFRYLDSRFASAVGIDSEARAAEALVLASDWMDTARRYPMTKRAGDMGQKLQDLPQTGSLIGDVVAFASAVGTDPVGFASFLSQVAAQSAPSIAAGAVTTAVTRDPAKGAAVMGISSGVQEGYGEVYDTLSSALGGDGKPKYDLTTVDGATAALNDAALLAEANDRGQARGLIIGLLDGISGGIAGKTLAKSKAGDMVLQMMVQSALGGGGEALAQLATDGEVKIGDVLIEALAELVMAPLEVAGVGGKAYLRDRQRSKEAGDTATKLGELTEAANKSKLRQRSPDKFLEAVKTQGLDQAEIFIPAEKVQEFFQMDGGFDLDAFGITSEALETALLTGGDVAVPLSHYATYLSGDAKASAFVMRNGSLRPDAEMSAAELETFNAQDWAGIMELELDALEQREAADAAAVSAAERVHSEVYDQLRGRYGADAADSYAKLISARMAEAAIEMGTDALTLWSGLDVSIDAGGATARTVRRRGDVDIAVNELRARGRQMTPGRDQTVAMTRKAALDRFPELKQKRPFTNAIAGRGGVAPGSPAAKELAQLGINSKTAPGLFKKGGLTDLDNIVAGEIFTGPVLAEDGNGYLDRDAVYDAIAREARGEQIPFSPDAIAALEEIDALERGEDFAGAPSYAYGLDQNSPAAMYAAMLDEQGLDLDELDNDAVAAALGVADERGTSFVDGEAVTDPDGAAYDQPGGEVKSEPNLGTGPTVAMDRVIEALGGEVISRAYDDKGGFGDEAVIRISGTDLQISIREDDTATYLMSIASKVEGDLTQVRSGSGAGSAAIEALKAYADESGKPLAVAGATDPAKGFYEKLGLVPADVTVFMDDGYLTSPATGEGGWGMVYRPDISETLNTESEAFKRWFGDSKVVDADGKPLVVYHGTGAAIGEDFAFDPGKIGSNFGFDKAGFFFTDSERLSQQYASMSQEEMAELRSKITEAQAADIGRAMRMTGAGKEILSRHVAPVYLSIQNPLTKREVMAHPKFKDAATTTAVDFFDTHRDLINEIAAEAGNDGIIIDDRGDSLFVAFDPNQIKSVNNRGTWDPADDRIMFQVADPVSSDAFKSWFGESKIVNPDGSPKEVFHGSSEKVEAFNHRKAQDKQGRAAALGLGRGKFYLSDDKTVAEAYASMRGGSRETVGSYFIKAEKPMHSDEYARRYREISGGREIFSPYDASYDMFDRDLFIEDLDAQIRAEGFDAIIDDFGQIAVFDPVQIKATDNTGSWDPSDARVLYQGSDEPPLYVTHNLSATKLRHASDLGGLAAPSLAVGRGDIGFDDFGEISLIGAPSMADPKSKGVRIFNADVYSPRQPRARFKVAGKAYDAMRRVINPVAEKYGLRIRIDQGEVERGGFSAIAGEDAAKAAWLEAIGEPVPVVRDGAGDAPGPIEGYEQFSGTTTYDVLREEGFEAAAIAFFESRISAQEQKADQDKVRSRFYNEDGTPRDNMVANQARAVASRNATIAEAKSSAGSAGKTDIYATGRALDDAVKGREAEFNSWVRSRFGEVVGDAFFETEAGRKKDYNLANLVKEMTRVIRNGEGWNYGGGNVRAAVAPEFKSLKDIKEARGQIQSSAALSGLKDEVNNEMFALADKFAEYAGSGQRFGWYDDFADFLRDMAKGPRAVAEWGWASKVPDELMGEAGAFLEKLKGLPTEYFEIKMQRAVAFSEFEAALIPADLDADARQILSDAGLQLVEYGGADGLSRADALGSLEDSVFFQGKDQKPEALGSIKLPAGGLGNGKTVISLFENANLSTFLHEAGHLFLEMDLMIEASGNASADFSARHKVLRDWLGMKEGQEKPTVAQHEKFARGFEAYLMEGKAPSIELGRSFASFRRWLRTLYQSLTDLRVKLTPEVRNVMDRMLASEDAIAEARAVDSVSPMFTQSPPGMAPSDWEAYKKLAQREADASESALLKRVMARIKKERTKEAKETKARITKEVTESLHKERRFRIISILGNGKWLSDSTAAVPDLRMDPKLAADAAGGIGILSEISNRKHGVKRSIFKKGGADPDVVASMFGYDNPREMFEELQNTPKLKDAIEAEVERRMAEELGDTLSDGSLQEAAELALRTDATADRGIAELRTMNKMRSGGGQNPTLKLMKAKAAKILSGMQTRHAAKPSHFLRAERKAAREAQDAFAKVVKGGEGATEALEAAYAAKERQILNQLLYREAMDFKDAMDRGRERFRGYDRARVRAAIGSPHIERIDDLLASYEFRKKSEKWLSNREAMTAYIDRMIEEGREGELAIDPAVIAESATKHYSRMTVEEFLGLLDTVKNIENIGRRTGKIRDARRERNLAEVVDGIAESMRENLKRHKVSRSGSRTARERGRGTFRETMNWVLNADTHLRGIDGGEPGKAWWGIKAGIDKALSRYTERKMRVAKELDQVFEAYSMKERRDMSKRFYVAELGEDLSKWDLVVMALNSGNAANWERLTNVSGNGAKGFNAASVDAALAEHLTQKDWDFAQDLIDYINGFWPEIAEKERRMKGVSPKKVEAEVMSSAAPASFRGGYYPIAYDNRLSARADDLSVTDAADALRGGRFSSAATKNGHTKERVRTTNMAVDLGIGRVFGHVDQVLRDLELGEEVANSWMILSRLKQSFLDMGHKEDYEALEFWLKDTAAGDGVATHGVDKTLSYARSGFTISRLALNITTVALQPTGIAQSLVVVGKRAMLRGMVSYVKSMPSVLKGISARSPMMRERWQTMERDIHSITGEIDASGATGGRWQKLQRQYIVPASMALMAKVQYFTVDAPTWHGAYLKALDEGHDDGAASTLADHAVKRSQGSGLIADRGMMERGRTNSTARSEMPKLFTALGSYMFAKFNVAYERTAKVKSPADLLSWASDMALLFAFEAVTGMIIRGNWPDDDEEVPAAILKETALSALGTFPFVRDAASILQGFGGGGASASVLDLGVAQPLIAAGEVFFGGEDVDRKHLETLSNMAGIWLHLPSAQTNRILKALLEEDLSIRDDPDFMGAVMGQAKGRTLIDLIEGN